jgi:hypothetical protein
MHDVERVIARIAARQENQINREADDRCWVAPGHKTAPASGDDARGVRRTD